MITEYHRPKTVEDALALLNRDTPMTIPLGGGTVVSQTHGADYAVVDLQALGLEKVICQGNRVHIGAAARLQQLLGMDCIPEALQRAIKRTESRNLREMSSLAGSLVTATGQSTLAAVFMAVDARLVWLPGELEESLGDFLALRNRKRPEKLIKEIVIPNNIKVGFEAVGRSPDDVPFLIVAMAHWSSGRSRLVVGGYGAMPVLVSDGNNDGDLEVGFQTSCSQWNDHRASAEYRIQVGGALLKRLSEKLA